jgi:signal transduction histidine kinase
MAHPDARDLVDAPQGRGYAPRVSPARPSWLREPSERAVDWWLVVGLGLVMTAASLSIDRPGLGVLLGVACVLPLLWRRSHPYAMLAAVLAIALAAPVDAPFELPVLVALYSIGSRRSWEATIAAVCAVVAAAAVHVAVGGPYVEAAELISLGLICTMAAGLGLYVGSRRARIAALTERADLLAERAVAEERVRIAQELHDVVAHNVSLIVVQAQALGATAGDDKVREATDGIADLGREAMAEMHRTLKLLRAGEEPRAELAPQPGLADLDDLLARTRGAGVPVELAVEGEPRPLPQAVDLSAYRIVQEALTNVIKHAGRARTTVRLGYRAEALELTIADAGEGVADVNGAGGHGIVGMRERAALFGGTLTAGPLAGRGFEVRALLPYGGGGGR